MTDDPAHIVVAKRSSRQKLTRRNQQQLSLQGASRANPPAADLSFCQAISTASAAPCQTFPNDSVTLRSLEHHRFLARSLSSASELVLCSAAIGMKYLLLRSRVSTSLLAARNNAVAAASVSDCPMTWNVPLKSVPVICRRAASRCP